ncbi:MAG TPA: protein kinase [Polyangiaceae bacterium]
MPFEPGVVVGGRYRIVSLIGVGGVGRVYLARHIELDTEVAIKVLRPEMSERADAVQRFAREARASVRLRSERIARVLDVGSHEDKPYFVMEYLIGCNLLEVRQQADIDIATLCEFFIQACEGLADAHAQGIVHRDIKPENLFVVRDASGWRSLKVFDFGISKFSLTGKFSDVDLAAMRTEAMMGTPHYISPEQIRSTRDVDHRTDLWSLGAVMFEVLSGGILPFREEREVTALVAEVLERPHRSLLDIAPNVPERLAAIVDRCLEKNRDFRYQTAAEVALDLLPLAPARARASVERAVSVMQAAGLMPLNGDLESLRPMPAPHSDRVSRPSPLIDVQAASGMRLSEPGPGSVLPAASVQPVVVTRSALLTAPQPLPVDGQRRSRTLRVGVALLLLAGGLLAGIFFLGTGTEPANLGPKPQAAAAIPGALPEPALVSPAATEPSVSPRASASAANPASSARPVPPKTFAAPRPAAPKASSVEPPPSPPQNKLELRRER